ncbi:MAG: DUF5658 family protein [Armatimonadetes bacterium]|nr:DUF5658 family protein [Armatimonadota bacterium]
MKLTRESMVLIALCGVDLVSTLLLLRTNTAREGNPIMAFYLRHGIGTFVLAKLTLIFLPVFIAEWSKQYRPKFVRLMLRAAILTYAGMYLVLFLTINVVAQTPTCPDPLIEPVRQGAGPRIP